MKDWFPRLFEGLVFRKMKPLLIDNISKYQIGAKPGHQAQEHLFVLKSIMSLYKHLKLPLYANFWDIRAYFDKQPLKYALEAVWGAGVRGKQFRLLYKLNKDTNIKALTPIGLTDEAYTGENTGQGSLPASIVSSLHLDRGVTLYFSSSSYQICYGKVKINPMSFQDDCMSLQVVCQGLRTTSLVFRCSGSPNNWT